MKPNTENRQTAYTDETELQDYIRANHKTIAGVAIGIDFGSGAFAFDMGDNRIIFATPLWEGFCSIPVDEYTDAGDYKRLADVPFAPTGDLEADALQYIEAVTKFLIPAAK